MFAWIRSAITTLSGVGDARRPVAGIANTRTGMIVGKQLADQFGWKIGQKIPIASNIWPLRMAARPDLDLVGIFDGKDEDWKKRTQPAFIQMII